MKIGIGTAVVTPFDRNGEVNERSLANHIDNLISRGVESITVLGTTGEASTLSAHERYRVIAVAKEIIANRATLIVGVGTNDTAKSLEYIAAAEKEGADCLLAITPYYNKCNNNGAIAHFGALAKATALPILLYNVPSRTGYSLPIEVIRSLLAFPNIIGIKEAEATVNRLNSLGIIVTEQTDSSTDYSDCSNHKVHVLMSEIDNQSETMSHSKGNTDGNTGKEHDLCIKNRVHGRKLHLICGEDCAYLPFLAYGANGIISVVANVAPELIVALRTAYVTNPERAIFLNTLVTRLSELLFCEVNPIPVKFALNLLGADVGLPRLPLAELSHSLRDRFEAQLFEIMREIQSNVVASKRTGILRDN
ncbi:MAG: 4-hydroxy-tetrahydrodipicolinate synthase [Clostridia bacterium]|nr:4-hydroxy-tetrahydrodipicolinate synthase [Clostridia bacterium]